MAKSTKTSKKKTSSKTVKGRSKQSARKNSKKKNSSTFRGFLFRLFIWLFVISALVFAAFVFYLDRQVVNKFSGKKWAVPAHVYARPLELYEGLSISPAHILEEAKSLGYFEGQDKIGSISKKGNTLHLYTRGFRFIDTDEVAQNVVLSFAGNQITSIKNKKNDKAITLLRLEPLMIGGIYPDHNEDRMLVKYEELPKALVDTLLAVEDRSYFSHYGISIRGISRALYSNITSDRSPQGGSTLTQQLVKNFYLSSERSLKRKGIEAIMALLLEFHYSKEEILETYANEIYLGQNREKSIHGFGLASHYYFNKPLDALDLNEIALLVGIVKGPSRYDPNRKPENALARRNQVLEILKEQKLFDAKSIELAKSKPLLQGSSKASLARVYPAYLDLIHRQLKRDYEEKDLKSDGLKVFTTFDPQVQWQAERSLAYYMKNMEKRVREKDRDQLQAAIVVLNPENGEVLAVVGDKKAQYAGFNRAIDAQRPIGSLVKPAVYLAALQQKEKYSLATVLSDRKVSMMSGNERWDPQNFDKREHGDVMLYRALAVSYNLATVRLGLNVGLNNVVKTLEGLGIQGNIPAIPALTLGALDRSPYEVAEMYQTIASNGFYTPLRTIREVTDANREPLKRYPLKVEKRFESDVVYLLQFAMHEVVRAGTAKSIGKSISRDIELAGKTGTSNEQRDSWFAGFGANRLAVVWVGRDDNKPMPFSGSTGALPIWTNMMARLQPRSLDLFEPQGVENHWIDASNGTVTYKSCPNAISLPFIEGYEPSTVSACINRSRIKSQEDALQEQLLKAGKNVLDWMSDMVQ